MKISFSRKGFDSATGGSPSPIIDGCPISLPIPTTHRSSTTYRDIGLGEIVAHVTRNKVSDRDLCHFDPMFQGGHCAFGQTGTAQSHMAKHGFGAGDIFLFFGLFADENGRDRHHRFFGYLRVSEKIELGATPPRHLKCLKGFRQRHPHTIGSWNDNNTLYVGRGNVAKSASDELRLSIPGMSPSYWRIPTWLEPGNLTYHSNPARWAIDGQLKAAARGQEFITDISNDRRARRWVDNIIRHIDEGHPS